LINQAPSSKDQLFRLVLQAYGLSRVTEQVIVTLEEARKVLQPNIDLA